MRYVKNDFLADYVNLLEETKTQRKFNKSMFIEVAYVIHPTKKCKLSIKSPWLIFGVYLKCFNQQVGTLIGKKEITIHIQFLWFTGGVQLNCVEKTNCLFLEWNIDDLDCVHNVIVLVFAKYSCHHFVRKINSNINIGTMYYGPNAIKISLAQRWRTESFTWR